MPLELSDYKLPFKVKFIVASRHSREEFFEKTLTGQSLSLWPWEGMEVHLFPENDQGLGVPFNRAINKCIDEDCIMVFAHDDLALLDYYWPFRIYEGLKKYNVVGVAGCKRYRPNQIAWAFWRMDEEGIWCDDDDQYSGMVAHGTEWPPQGGISYFGNPDQPVALLDGQIYAAHTSAFQRGLRFGEEYKYHMYDVDFCRTASTLGLTLGTIQLAVMHRGQGTGYDSDAWWEDYHAYCKKWGETDPQIRVPKELRKYEMPVVKYDK